MSARIIHLCLWTGHERSRTVVEERPQPAHRDVHGKEVCEKEAFTQLLIAIGDFTCEYTIYMLECIFKCSQGCVGYVLLTL